jgi:hypothetical protein
VNSGEEGARRRAALNRGPPARWSRLLIGVKLLLCTSGGTALAGESAEGEGVGEASEGNAAKVLDETGPSEPRDVALARERFRAGARAVARADWAEALAAFEQSAELRSHPVTSFNIGVCERALGQYTRALLTFHGVRAASEGGEPHVSEALLAQTRAFIDEIDGLLARVVTRISPAGARISVDGRPLRRVAIGSRAVYFGGAEPPGPAARAPEGTFEIVVDPGARVFTVSRAGFGEVVETRTLSPGARADLSLELSRLPAELHIESNRPGAVVSLDTLDVGVAPVTLQRPAGEYDVVVRKPGFVTYETRISLKAGEHANLRANLPQLEPALTERWWFWTIAGVVVTGAAVTTYALTRPEPERPAPDGGSLGWVVEAR